MEEEVVELLGIVEVLEVEVDIIITLEAQELLEEIMEEAEITLALLITAEAEAVLVELGNLVEQMEQEA